MDIQGSQTPERAQKTYEQRQRALIDANRALVRAARESLAAVSRARAEQTTEAPRDEVRLSEAAQASAQPSSAEREAHVRELAEAHRMDRLHTPERLERAAQRLLDG